MIVNFIPGLFKKFVFSWLAFIVGPFIIVGSVSAAANKLTVITSVPPHAFIVESLVGQQVKVISLVDQGSDPHTYSPSPKQMLELSQAAVLFTAGLEFERGFLAKIQAINKKLVVTSLAENEDGLGHDDTHEEHDGHEDLHTWLSPDTLTKQSETIYSELVKHLPAYRDSLDIRYAHLRERISGIKIKLNGLLEPYKNRVFYVFHPAFGHFGEAFSLKQKAVEVDNKRPTPKQLQTIINQSLTDRVRVVFSQPQFDQRSAKVVADAIGGKVAILDPLKKDVFTNYIEIATSLADSFK